MKIQGCGPPAIETCRTEDAFVRGEVDTGFRTAGVFQILRGAKVHIFSSCSCDSHKSCRDLSGGSSWGPLERIAAGHACAPSLLSRGYLIIVCYPHEAKDPERKLFSFCLSAQVVQFLLNLQCSDVLKLSRCLCFVNSDLFIHTQNTAPNIEGLGSVPQLSEYRPHIILAVPGPISVLRRELYIHDLSEGFQQLGVPSKQVGVHV